MAQNLSHGEREVERYIYLIRGQRVMLDSDLAQLYGVETKQLKRAVNRNIRRCPIDFLLRLEPGEVVRSRCQIGTLKRGQNIKYAPYAFTENGVAMLSSVLNSERAIQVNIHIMRVFTRLREWLSNHHLAERMEALEMKSKKHDKKIRLVIDAIGDLLQRPQKPRPPIGFRP